MAAAACQHWQRHQQQHTDNRTTNKQPIPQQTHTVSANKTFSRRMFFSSPVFPTWRLDSNQVGRSLFMKAKSSTQSQEHFEVQASLFIDTSDSNTAYPHKAFSESADEPAITLFFFFALCVFVIHNTYFQPQPGSHYSSSSSSSHFFLSSLLV